MKDLMKAVVSVRVLVGHLSQSLYGPHAVTAGGHRASEALPAGRVESAASQVDCLWALDTGEARVNAALHNIKPL